MNNDAPQGIEAQSGETGTGSIRQDESPARAAGAQNLSSSSPEGLQEPALREALNHIRSELALFAACCAVSNKSTDTFVGTEQKAMEWVVYINDALATLHQQEATDEGYPAIGFNAAFKEWYGKRGVWPRVFPEEAFEAGWTAALSSQQETGEAGNKLAAHFTRMMEAAANYLEPTTYHARHPDLSRVGDCKWVREFPEPNQHQSDSGKAEAKCHRDQAFISDMIYMLDGPEQRAALSTPTSQPPAAETRLAGDGLDHLTDDQWQDMLDAGQEALCQIRSITYFDDEEQEAIFRAMFATLTQPEPTAQQGGEE